MPGYTEVLSFILRLHPLDGEAAQSPRIESEKWLGADVGHLSIW